MTEDQLRHGPHDSDVQAFTCQGCGEVGRFHTTVLLMKDMEDHGRPLISMKCVKCKHNESFQLLDDVPIVECLKIARINREMYDSAEKMKKDNKKWDAMPSQWVDYWKYAHLPEDQVPKCGACGRVGETFQMDVFNYCQMCMHNHIQVVISEHRRQAQEKRKKEEDEKRAKLEAEVKHGERYPGETLPEFNERRKRHINANDTCQCKMCYEYMRDHSFWHYGRRSMTRDGEDRRQYKEMSRAYAGIGPAGADFIRDHWHRMTEVEMKQRQDLTDAFMRDSLSYEDYFEDHMHIANRDYDKVSEAGKKVLGLTQEGAPIIAEAVKKTDPNNLALGIGAWEMSTEKEEVPHLPDDRETREQYHDGMFDEEYRKLNEYSEKKEKEKKQQRQKIEFHYNDLAPIALLLIVVSIVSMIAIGIIWGLSGQEINHTLGYLTLMFMIICICSGVMYIATAPAF